MISSNQQSGQFYQLQNQQPIYTTTVSNNFALQSPTIKESSSLGGKQKSFTERVFQLEDFKNKDIYIGAFAEFVGSLINGYVGQMAIVSLVNSEAVSGITIAISQALLLALLIWALATTSQAHFNPSITWSCYLCNVITFPRMIVYLIAQLLGYILAAIFVREALDNWDSTVTAFEIGGFAIGDATLSSAFLTEFMFSVYLLIMAHGCAFDKHQGKIYNPILGPGLIGVTLANGIWCSVAINPNSTGAGMNAFRGLGPAIVAGDCYGQTVFVFGEILAGVAHAIFYKISPPKPIPQESVKKIQ